ncbi:MAG TPA: glycosyltransferase, partial [Candidatus Binatia bacterium]|nr:glycosyltransferase [Candidatus Binatia bacterium]
GLAVRDGEHVVVADEADAIAAATTALIRAPERARVLARAGRALVERAYRWEDSAAAVEAAWRDALQKKP